MHTWLRCGSPSSAPIAPGPVILCGAENAPFHANPSVDVDSVLQVDNQP